MRCLLAYMENDILLDTLGIYIQRSEPVLFYDSTVTVYLSRHYTNNICNEAVLSKVQSTVDCADKSKNRAMDEVKKQLALECAKIWDSQISQLQDVIPKNRQSRTEHDMVATTALASPFRRRKSVLGMLTGINLFTGIISTFVSSVSSLYMFLTRKELTDNMHTLKSNLIQRQDKSDLIAANVMSNLHEHINILSESICDDQILNSARIKQLNANILITELVDNIENEILSLSFNELPKHRSFLNLLLELCLKIENNNENFCKTIIFEKLISFTFEGTTLNDNALIAMVRLNMPVRSLSFKDNQKLMITNIGDFEHGKYYQLNLPTTAIQLKNEFVYELDESQCVKNLCHLNDINLTTKARCLNSLINTKTDFCVQVYSEAPTCVFYKIPSGYLILAPRSIFFPEEIDSSQAVRLSKKVFYIKAAGRLLCNNGITNSSHFLSDPYIKIVGNSTLDKRERIDIVHRLNTSRLSEINDLEQTLKFELARLTENDDKLFIGNNNVPTLHVIIGTCLTIAIMFLVVYLIFCNFSAIIQQTLKFLFWIRSKCGVLRTEMAIQTDIELKNVLTRSNPELTLRNGDHSETIYPRLIETPPG